jgi:hypothetical protein
MPRPVLTQRAGCHLLPGPFDRRRSSNSMSPTAVSLDDRSHAGIVVSCGGSRADRTEI